MKGKWRILSVLLLAAGHAFLAYRMMMDAYPVVMDHFDTVEPFTAVEKLQLAVTFILLAPYYLIMSLFFGTLSRSPIFLGALMAANSMVWGYALDRLFAVIRLWYKKWRGRER